MQIFSKTDIGKVRSSNQDAFKFNLISDTLLWALVCDGMGGANGGNVASQICTKVIKEVLNEKFVKDLSDDELKNLCLECVERANIAIFAMAFDNPGLRGMGTTAVLVLIDGDRLIIVHVGDSRAYLLRNGELVQLTRDHSFVQGLVDMGEITIEEARTHPRKNIITRSVGVRSTLKADYTKGNFEENDVILICTDGLTNYANDDVLKGIIVDNSKEMVTEKLIEFAKISGGADNITATVIFND